MRTSFILYTVLIFSLSASCREEIYFPEKTTGTIILNSTPQRANIFLDANNTGRVTPDSISGLQPGFYPITLKLNGFRDTTFEVNLKAGQKPYIHIRLDQ